MSAEWDIPARPKADSGSGPQVAVVVPLPAELGGAGEILVLAAFGSLKLPAGDLHERETSFRAAGRIALGMAGAEVLPERLIYVLEQPGKPLTLCILCALDQDVAGGDTKPGAAFRRVEADSDLDPAALREVLAEDAQAGFVRPVAHVVVSFDDAGQETVALSW